MKLLAFAAIVAMFVAFVLYAVSAAPEPTPYIEQVGQSIALW